MLNQLIRIRREVKHHGTTTEERVTDKLVGHALIGETLGTPTLDPAASDILYIKALAAPFTISTIPDKTLLAFADHGSVGELMAAHGGDVEEMIAKFAKAGIDYDKVASDLQREATESFVKDWNEMLASIASKSAAFKAAG